jgi:hypothetical protein
MMRPWRADHSERLAAATSNRLGPKTMRHDFVPGAVDYEGAMSRDFNAGRALSAASMGVWRVIFEPYLARPGRVVDIGSGTGRFAVLLAKWFDAHSGFAFEAVQRVVQQTCSSLKELADRTRLRADTTLALMIDESFATRQTALERAAAVEMRPTPAIETLDLLVLQKIAA